VFRQGVACDFSSGDRSGEFPVGFLNIVAAVVFNVSNTQEARENEVFRGLLEKI
jgi:hypothetical protein